MRLIDAEGNQAGVVKLPEALAMAETAGLDLVEVAPNADPPVVRIINWSKFQYQQQKLEQKARKKHKVQDLKQIRMGVKIGAHDLEVKERKMREFLEDGDKVKVSVMFRGREITHQELGRELLAKVVADLGELAAVDQPPELLGRFLNMTIRKK